MSHSASSVEPAESETPLVYFEARRPWELIDIPQLWRHRDLWLLLGYRDVQVRYRQTVIGVIWCLLQPLASMAIFATLFGWLGRPPADTTAPYALIVLSGVVAWQLFATIVGQATQSLVVHQSMIRKVAFPRLFLPLATVIPALLDFGISVGLILLAVWWWQVPCSLRLLLLPVATVGLLLPAIGLGVWLSALNAQYRDIGFAVPFCLQLGFFVSPVVYQVSVLVPESWRPLFWVNPVSGMLEAFRWTLLPSTPFPTAAVLVGGAVSCGLLFGGLAYFRRVELALADCV